MGTGLFHWSRFDRSIAIFTQALKLIGGLFILVAFQSLGEFVVRTAEIDLPAPLMGMILLLLVLLANNRLATLIEPASHLLIKNLVLIFIPISLGVFFLTREIYQHTAAVLAVLFLSTPLTMLFMSLLIKQLNKSSRD